MCIYIKNIFYIKYRQYFILSFYLSYTCAERATSTYLTTIESQRELCSSITVVSHFTQCMHYIVIYCLLQPEQRQSDKIKHHWQQRLIIFTNKWIISLFDSLRSICSLISLYLLEVIWSFILQGC